MTLAAGKGGIERAQNQPLREAIAHDNEDRRKPRRGQNIPAKGNALETPR